MTNGKLNKILNTKIDIFKIAYFVLIGVSLYGDFQLTIYEEIPLYTYWLFWLIFVPALIGILNKALEVQLNLQRVAVLAFLFYYLKTRSIDAIHLHALVVDVIAVWLIAFIGAAWFFTRERSSYVWIRIFFLVFVFFYAILRNLVIDILAAGGVDFLTWRF
jgi:hypothetical protein